MDRRELVGRGLLVAAAASMLLLAFLLVFYLTEPASAPPACGPPPLPGCWNAPQAFRIFLFHVPLAWTAYLSFGIVFAASGAYLKTRNPKWDAIASSAGEIGVVLVTLALVTGSIWNKAELGVYWRWEDGRLFATFILWTIYIAYVALHTGSREPEEARLAAVFGILAFAAVPLSYFSQTFLTSLHISIRPTFPPETWPTLLVGVIAFTLLFLHVLRWRLQVDALELRLFGIKETMEESA
ncbi:MAG: cytochrome c biogenesis protein [Candidatus Thermoplasmatota archaeon]